SEPTTTAPPAASAPPSAIASTVTLSAAERKAETARTPPTKPSTASASPAPAPKPSAPATPAEKPPAPVPPLPHAMASSSQAVTLADIDRDLVFDRLPSDQGIVTPIAPADEEPDPDTSD